MYTLTIPCIDSAVGNSNTTNARYDAQFNSISPCAYLRPTYISCRYDSFNATGSAPYSGYTFIALAFRKDAVDFLAQKKVLSIKLHLNIVSASPLNHSVAAYCPAGAAFVAGAVNGACAYHAGAGLDSLPPENLSLAAGWKIFTVQNLAALKNILIRGIKVQDNGPGTATLAHFTAFPHTHATHAPFIQIQYLDETSPPQCDALEPAASVVDSDFPVTFRWSYQQAVNAPQSHVSINLRQTGGAWQPLLTKSPQTTQSYTAQGGLPLRGDCQWQVQVFSGGGAIASAFSAVKGFLSTGSPLPPAITGVAASPCCTVSWQQETQTGFEAFLHDATGALLHHSGQQLSPAKSYRLPGLLPNGAYTVRLRTLNQQQRWSAFSSAATQVVNLPPASIAASVTPLENGTVRATFTASASFSSFYLLQNGTAVARCTAEDGATGTLIARTALGSAPYVVRGVHGGHYADSPAKTAVLSVPHALIGGQDTGDFLPLEKRRDAPALHRHTARAHWASVHYEGQTLPTAYTSGTQTGRHTLRFTVEDAAVNTALHALLGQAVIYKDCQGQCLTALLVGITAESGQGGVDVDITLEETHTGGPTYD